MRISSKCYFKSHGLAACVLIGRHHSGCDRTLQKTNVGVRRERVVNTERSHLQTCLAAAVAPSDAEPAREGSLSVTCALGKICSSSFGLKAAKESEATPPFLAECIKSAEAAARLILPNQSAGFASFSSPVCVAIMTLIETEQCSSIY